MNWLRILVYQLIQMKTLPQTDEVLNIFSEYTETFDEPVVEENAYFSCFVLFLHMADEAIEQLGIEDDELIYSSRVAAV